MSDVITYDPRFKRAYRDLNLAWIEKHFHVEQKDLDQVDNPEVCLSCGGQIFFVIENNEAVGTCAMYKVGNKKYELAKMAVDPAFQGRGFGDLLMTAAEKWALDQQAQEILILSNTVLEPAIRLYKKHGFATTHLGKHPDYDRCNIGMVKKLVTCR
jgi:putative acetyltransferase